MPFSSLTAQSDYVQNKKYKPQPESRPPFDKDLVMRLYHSLPPMNQRAVDAHRRARQNPTE